MDKKDTLYARMLTGELTQAEEKALKSSGEWDEIWKIAKYADDLALPEYNQKEALKKIEKRTSNASLKIRKIFSYRAIGIAASLLILIGAFFFFGNNTTTVSAAFAEKSTHTLPDNSTVEINSGSEISYNKNNWKNQRLVELSGEAFFKVEKGNSFVVQTNLGEVEVLGTSFNIRSHRKKFSVACYSGKVNVRAGNSEKILTKGQTVVFNNFEKGAIKTFSEEMPPWLSGVSEFTEENLNDVFDEIERQFDVEILTPQFDKKFTGAFAHDNLHQALNQVCLPMGVSFEITNNQEKVIISN